MDVFDFLYDPEEELNNLVEELHPNREYNIRPRTDHFNYWSEKDFFDRFRFSKPTVVYILSLIEEDLRNRTGWNFSRAISSLDKVLLTLRFLATGDFYIAIGDFIGIHKTTAGRIIKQVVTALCGIFPQYVYLPRTEEEQREAQRDFFMISRFPRIIGAMDCTHIKIQSPGGDNAEVYRNRKGFFSLNCQIVCSAKLKIIDLVSRWPGSANDSHIFDNSAIKMRFQNGEMGNGVLLADRGYALKPYVLTPLDEPHNEVEHLYNEAQIRTRNTVERLFGVWKRRFAILSTGIRCKTEFAQMVIVACAVLHNILVDQKEELFEGNIDEDPENENVNNLVGQEGIGARIPFIDYFQNILNQNL